MSRRSTLLRLAVAALMAPFLAGCLDSGPSLRDGSAQLYRPAFGGTGGAASSELAGVRAPTQMTCRFLAATGRVDCDPVTLNGVTYRASYQFLDARGEPQPARDDFTDVVNERTDMRGVPTDVGLTSTLFLAFDSVSSTSDVTRRGMTGATYTIVGTHRVRTLVRLLLDRDTVRQSTDAGTEWRELRYPRTTVAFRPVLPTTLTPGMNVDSLAAVSRLSGAWAERGERIDDLAATQLRGGRPSVVRSRTVVTYESPDAARVVQQYDATLLQRSSTCRVDRLSFSAVCQ
ncbi:MAG: hypothetical protein MUE41_11180 [Gemmatimonadaceae bacterium]|nr:hypothetical protein [Gemmatimonadaceae bacterium]